MSGSPWDDTVEPVPPRTPIRPHRHGVRPALATLALVIGTAWTGVTPAGAAGGVTISPDPVPVALNGATTATVRWTGQKPRTLIFVRLCNRSITDPTFNEALDCSLLSEVTPNGTPDGSGSVAVSVFRGPEPGGDNAWGCFAAGDVPPPGISASTTCFVRVTNNVVSNKDDDVEVPYTIANGPAAPVPGGPAVEAGSAPPAEVAGVTGVAAGPGRPAVISLAG